MRRLAPILVALALGCGRTDASAPVEDSKPAAQDDAEPEAPQPPDLSQHAFPLLVWSAFEVEQDYFDKSRLDPRGQLVAAAEALGLHTPEFFAEVAGDTLKVRVRSATAEFALGDLGSVTGAAIRLEQVLEFAQGVLDLEPEALHELEYAAINGLFAPLDPHTILLTPEQHADLGVRTKGEFGGVGAQIRSEARRIVIVGVLPGMPADKAGVVAGDVVLTIDGESTVNMTSEEAQQRLRGPVGSKVALVLLRGRKRVSVEVYRDTIKIESVRAVQLPDGVAYLAVSGFQETTAAEARKALEGLGEPKAVVLDLRGNSGGVLLQASQMIDDFVARGELVVVRSAGGDEIAEAEEPTVVPLAVPVVVLVDEESASAAEIVAGGLQALGRAVVVGRSSFGKGTVQMVRAAAPYGQELALKLTVAEWMVAGKRPIQTRGVVPDLVLAPVEPSGVAAVARFYDEERFERARERSRIAHLPSARHELADTAAQADRDALRLRYLAAAPAEPSGPRELADPEIGVAFELGRDLAAVAPGNARSDTLVATAARLSAREDFRIAAALARAGVDWSAPPANPPKPDLAASMTITPNTPVVAGEPFGLTLTVENRGDAPVHRVHAITDCVHDELDGIEIMVGQVPAGGRVTREITLHVMPWHNGFVDAIDASVHVGEPGEQPLTRARAMFEIADGPRPALAYEYWIVDDATLAERAPARPVPEDGSERSAHVVAGNGDGALQPGERVLLGFVAHNLGTGESPSVRALVRNLSGRQGLLEEGFVSVGRLAPGQSRAGAFGLTVSEGADPSLPVELELVLGDATLRLSAQDRLRFRVLPSRPGYTAGRSRVQVGSESARLYAGAHPSAAVAATADSGAQLDVLGKLDGYHVLDGGGLGRRWFLPADLAGLGPAVGKGAAAAVHPRIQVRPPTVELAALPRTTKAASIELSGTVRHPERARDVVVLVRPPGTAQVDHKVYFQANDASTGAAATSLDFRTAVPLAPGGNRITILARDGAKVVQRHDVWVYREPE
ncbi:MAG: PDZ domain-containing protein [Nannocystaceae bacterium]|nr:PDZ domain-containing protein [Nannocystaceae bacterium]